MPSQPFHSSAGTTPRHLLSNGRFSTMLSASGSGFSRWRGLAVTRWREDPVADPWGSFLLLRDESDGTVWSVTTQPMGVARPDDAVEFGPGCARFSGRHLSLHHELEVAVAPTVDVELRRMFMTILPPSSAGIGIRLKIPRLIDRSAINPITVVKPSRAA